MGFLQFETARLALRPFVLDDVDDLHRLWIDPGVRKYLWDDQIIPREAAVAIVECSVASFETTGLGFWSIRFKGDPMLIGFCGLRYFTEDGADESEVEILYGVAPDYWGKGIAVEASAAILRYGFDVRNLLRIYAGADPYNTASFRVIEKLGLTFAGKTFVSGLEVIYYGMSRDEYRTASSDNQS